MFGCQTRTRETGACLIISPCFFCLPQTAIYTICATIDSDFGISKGWYGRFVHSPAFCRSHWRGAEWSISNFCAREDAKMWIRIQDQPGESPICSCLQIGIHSANPPRTRGTRKYHLIQGERQDRDVRLAIIAKQGRGVRSPDISMHSAFITSSAIQSEE